MSRLYLIRVNLTRTKHGPQIGSQTPRYRTHHEAPTQYAWAATAFLHQYPFSCCVALHRLVSPQFAQPREEAMVGWHMAGAVRSVGRPLPSFPPRPGYGHSDAAASSLPVRCVG